MMKDTRLIALVAAILLVVAGLFVWQHVAQLNTQLGDLTQRMQELGHQVEAAEERASRAEEQAEAARADAGEAAQRATEAATREQESAQQASEERSARQQAEERERLAEMARREAEIVAEASSTARAAAEAERVAAERRSAAAQQEAAQAKQEAELARAETEKVRKKLKEELDRLQGALGRIANTRRTALGLVMTLDSDQIEFDFNKADLRPRNRELLARIAGVLLTFEHYGIQVFGHTDDVGSVEYNEKLSEQRAAAVRDYLVEAGIDPEITSTMGLGKSSPLVDGTDTESRQRNRRVELAIVFSEGEFEAVQAQAGD